jgi:myo-inositol-1-phosphate synthase
MPEPLRLAVCGVGNNISALFQGAQYYRELTARGVPAADLPGIKHPEIGGLSVADIDFVAAFDVHPDKVGATFSSAVLAPPNNYPLLDVTLPETSFVVDPGLTAQDCAAFDPAFNRIVRRLRDTRADVLLYSLPTGLQWAGRQPTRRPPWRPAPRSSTAPLSRWPGCRPPWRRSSAAACR